MAGISGWPNPVLLQNCWAFRNGINYWGDTAFTGNGNGFKLGGNYVPAPHRVVNCVAFHNAANGFDQNNNTAGQTLDNNTAWANGSANINLNHGTLTQGVHVLRNNLSIAGTVSVQSSATQTTNSWQLITAAVSDVLSTDESLALAARRDDGGLPETQFLRPAPGGRLMDRGTNIGTTYFGSAPDLGAYETPTW